MKERMLSKSLVVGVIFLFVGIGIQPAFADVSITTASDSEDDCDICPKVSNHHLVRLKSLINRLEKYENILPLLSKHNPKVVDKYQELFNRISTLVEMNSYSDICDKLWMLLIPIAIVCGFFAELLDINPSSIIWIFIFYPPVFTFCSMGLVILAVMSIYECFMPY